MENSFLCNLRHKLGYNGLDVLTPEVLAFQIENMFSLFQLVPYFVLDVLNYPGFPGVFLAVLFSGALR